MRHTPSRLQSHRFTKLGRRPRLLGAPYQPNTLLIKGVVLLQPDGRITASFALDELPIATSIFHNQTSSLLPPGLSSSLKDLRNASNAMLTILPASEEPPVTPIEPRVAWIALFDELYGTTGIIGPDPEMVALNANIRATLTLIANLTEPLEQYADNCNNTANAAPEQLTSIEASLTAALKVCEATTEEGAALEQQLSDVIDSAAHAEAVTVCGWVHDCYQRAMDLTCNNGHEQLELFGILLSAAAIALWIGVCALCCTRQVRPPVALSRRASPDTPQRGGGSGSSGGMRPSLSDELLRTPSLLEYARELSRDGSYRQEEHVVAVRERESPFATYSGRGGGGDANSRRRACRQAGGRAARCRFHKAANRSLYQPSCTTRLGRVLGRAPPQTAVCIPTHALANGSLPARPLPLSTSPCYAACRRVIVMPCRIRACPLLALSVGAATYPRR